MNAPRVKLVVPTGRMQAAVLQLLADAGLAIDRREKEYRPASSDGRFEIKFLKAANIPELVELGAHDLGFSGLDWVRETNAQVATVLDTGLLPVAVVAAAPRGVDPFREGSGRAPVVASEYERITAEYMDSKCSEWTYVRTHGATEVFPPEDADLIVDNVASGRTLAANNLEIIDEILKSSTMMIANVQALEDSSKAEIVEELKMMVASVLDARQRVLLDMNVPEDRLEAVVSLLPAMRSPTVQRLHGDQGFAVRAAVPRADVNCLILSLKKAGATDLLQSAIQRVIA